MRVCYEGKGVVVQSAPRNEMAPQRNERSRGREGEGRTSTLTTCVCSCMFVFMRGLGYVNIDVSPYVAKLNEYDQK